MYQWSSLLLAAIVFLGTPFLSAQTSNNSNTSSAEMTAEEKAKFSKANPEDISNENFPKTIENFDYPNADLTDVVSAISKLTGKNFILDSNVRGKITIIAPSQITVAEAYKAFLSALAMNNLTIVPSGRFLKIRQSRNAQKDSIDTYSGRYFPATDQIITRIVKLKYISAEQLQKQFRNLASKDGDFTPYPPTNSLIITDYGSNIERIMNIINELDVPGFEEKLAVIRIRFAKAKDIADLIEQIINKGQPKSTGRFSSSRFRGKKQAKSGGSESFSLVIPDDRTNSIIVVGNQDGIKKIRQLVSKLDFKLRPEDSGNVFVYYLRYGDSKKISTILGGIAQESAKVTGAGSSTSKTSSKKTSAGSSATAIFGGDVKITADEDNNSLIISASKQDYQVVKSLLEKMDIPRDQVFVKAIIMELAAQKGINWGVDYYHFVEGTDGIGRAGFRSSSLDGLINPTSDSGAILGFKSGDVFDFNLGGNTVKVASLTGLIKFLKKNVGANILSTPQIMALDNVEAEIEVGETIPVGKSDSTGASGVTSTSITREKATIKLTITPFISPDSEKVRLKIDQKVAQASKRKVQAKELAEASVVIDERSVKTEIVVDSEDTAVIGGLMKDEESEEETKVPILGDIPILGWLFKSKNIERSKTNLLVFITPKIIRNMQDNSELLNSKLNERIEFIQTNLKGRDPYGAEVDKLPRKAFNEAPQEEILEGPVNNTIELEGFDDEEDFEDEETENPAESPAKETF